jgi:hypothetical protein
MLVLYKKVQSNPANDFECVTGLKWHRYYDKDERKFFLLYKFLAFLECYCFGGGAVQVDPPIEDSKLPLWNRSPGGEIHAAVQRFLERELSGRNKT